MSLKPTKRHRNHIYVLQNHNVQLNGIVWSIPLSPT